MGSGSRTSRRSSAAAPRRDSCCIARTRGCLAFAADAGRLPRAGRARVPRPNRRRRRRAPPDLGGDPRAGAAARGGAPGERDRARRSRRVPRPQRPRAPRGALRRAARRRRARRDQHPADAGGDRVHPRPLRLAAARRPRVAAPPRRGGAAVERVLASAATAATTRSSSRAPATASPRTGSSARTTRSASTTRAGTTGRPKGVMFTHRGAALNALAEVVHARLEPRSVFLWTLPMFHCNGWCFTWAVTAAAATHVCLPKVDPPLIWRADRRGARHAPERRADRARDARAPTTPPGSSTARSWSRPRERRRLAAVIERMEALGVRDQPRLRPHRDVRPDHDLRVAARPGTSSAPASERALKARQGVHYVTADSCASSTPTSTTSRRTGRRWARS